MSNYVLLRFGLNASISVVANEDGEGSFVSDTFMCKVIQTAYTVVHGIKKNLFCRSK